LGPKTTASTIPAITYSIDRYHPQFHIPLGPPEVGDGLVSRFEDHEVHDALEDLQSNEHRNEPNPDLLVYEILHASDDGGEHSIQRPAMLRKRGPIVKVKNFQYIRTPFMKPTWKPGSIRKEFRPAEPFYSLPHIPGACENGSIFRLILQHEAPARHPDVSI